MRKRLQIVSNHGILNPRKDAAQSAGGWPLHGEETFFVSSPQGEEVMIWLLMMGCLPIQQ